MVENVHGGGVEGEGGGSCEEGLFALKLHSDFDEIDWVSETSGCNCSDPAFDETLGGPHQRRPIGRESNAATTLTDW